MKQFRQSLICDDNKMLLSLLNKINNVRSLLFLDNNKVNIINIKDAYNAFIDCVGYLYSIHTTFYDKKVYNCNYPWKCGRLMALLCAGAQHDAYELFQMLCHKGNINETKQLTEFYNLGIIPILNYIEYWIYDDECNQIPLKCALMLNSNGNLKEYHIINYPGTDFYKACRYVSKNSKRHVKLIERYNILLNEAENKMNEKPEYSEYYSRL